MKKILIGTLLLISLANAGIVEKCIEKGTHEEHCYYLAGIAHKDGEKARQDTDKAVEYYTKACELKSDVACAGLGRAYLRPHEWLKHGSSTLLTFDVEKSIYFYNASCDLGNRNSCVVKSKIVPLVSLNKQCSENNATACFGYGSLLEQTSIGNSHQENVLEAYEKACELKEVDGCTQAARVYLRIRDEENTKKYSGIACELNDAQSCYNYAVTIQNEKPNDVETYLKKSCELEYGKACYYIGQNLERTKDMTNAKEFYGKACDYSYDAGCSDYKRVRNQLAK